MENFATISRKPALAEQYQTVRKQTIRLAEPLAPEDMVAQPVVDVSPVKWHLGHTAWFFEEFVLKKYYKGYKLFNERFLYIFNSYYEGAGERILRSNRGTLVRPLLEEVLDYRNYVDKHMADLISDPTAEVSYLVELGLNHEQQHQELLLTDIKYVFGNNPLFPAYQEMDGCSLVRQSPYVSFIEIPEGIYSVGHQGKDFCYDNEEPAHKVFCQSFRMMDRLVSNAEYLEFMKSGAYEDFRHWHMEGWEMVKALKWNSPLYWMQKGGDWYEYTLNGLKKLDQAAPVTHISMYEAFAYASWAGKRLLTESEWEVAASLLKPAPEHGNFMEAGIYHPCAPASKQNQMMGDCWEWTNSAYLPFPGYKRVPGALGEYNGKFMINQMVLKGGSCVTPVSHIRSTYRNFFHPDKRWQFTGIRLAEDI